MEDDVETWRQLQIEKKEDTENNTVKKERERESISSERPRECCLKTLQNYKCSGCQVLTHTSE